MKFKPIDPNSRPFVSKVEAAQLLGISYKTLTKMTDDGDLPTVKIGGLNRIRRTDIEALLKGNAA